MNKKNFIVLLSLIILCLPLFIININADIADSFTTSQLESIQTGGRCVSAPQSKQILYINSVNRWYIFYNQYDSATGNMYLKYSYSNLGDITSINNGGQCSHSLISNAEASDYIYIQYGNWFSVLHDENNNIGHFFYARNYYGQINDLYYRNFTISGDGSLTFGSAILLFESQAASNKIFVNAHLGNDSIPVLCVEGYWDTEKYIQMWKFDNYQVYSSSWECITVGYNVISSVHNTEIIPFGNEENCYLIVSASAYADEPLYYAKFDFDTATNGSVSLTSGFSVNTVNWEYCYDSARPSQSYFGISFNSTHACIAYSEGGSNHYKVYAFLYDFETETKSNEYLCLEGFEGEYLYPDVVIDENEFFVFAYREGLTTSNDSIIANEYSRNGLSPFNVTNQKTVVSDIDSHDFQPCFSISSFTNEGETVFIFSDDLPSFESINYGYGAIEGEYGEAPPPPEERPDPFDWSNVKYILLVFILLSIMIFAIYVKHGGRR